MSRQKGKVIRPFEYCLERARLALEDQLMSDLREKVFSTKEEAERKPDKIWREALRRLKKLRATADLNEEDEALARSYWWLAKTKRDYPEEFEKRIKPEEKKMEKVEAYCHHCGQKVEVENPVKRNVINDIIELNNECPACNFSASLFIPGNRMPITEIEFQLPERVGVDVSIGTGLRSPVPPAQTKIRFESTHSVVDLCEKMLNSLFREDLEFFPARKEDVMERVLNCCIQILEEKFGCKVTGGRCRDCKFFDKDISARFNNRGQLMPDDGSRLCVHEAFTFDETRTFVSPDHTCRYWTIKEVSEQEVEYYCETLGCNNVKLEKVSGHAYDYQCPSCMAKYEEKGGELVRWAPTVRL